MAAVVVDDVRFLILSSPHVPLTLPGMFVTAVSSPRYKIEAGYVTQRTAASDVGVVKSSEDENSSRSSGQAEF